ncbi:MAG: molybdopterin cofactor-binding domain-containing protein [Saccharofermentanales bacterium]
MALRVVGDSYPRLEAVRKINGTAKYTDDYTLPNMVYAMVKRSPYSHAKVISIDKTESEKVPGVLKILLPQDVPQRLYNSAVITQSPVFIEDQTILTDHPLFMGDRIAAVAATSEIACQEALDKLVIEYEILKPVFDVLEAMKEDADLLHPDLFDSNVFYKKELKRGDIDQGFAESDYIFEDEFSVPTVQNISLEPNGCICNYSDGGKLTIISTSQSPFKDKRLLARLLEMRENDIRVIKPIMGGGFGERQQIHNQPVAAIFSKELGRPVKIINSREEQMYGSTVRHSAKMKLKIGVSREGYLKAMLVDNYLNSGAYANVAGIVVNISLAFTNYKIPHFLGRGYAIYTNHVPGGAMRGFGNPQATFAREVMFEKIAKALQLDPVDFRRKNHVNSGDKIPGSEKTVFSCAMEECIVEAEQIRKNIDLGANQKKPESNHIKEAWGVAFGCHPSGAGTIADASGCLIMINSDGTVSLLTGSADIGQGSETILSQIAAEGLGIDLNDITIIAADTEITPYETGTVASSQAYRAGNAVTQAVEDCIHKTKERLARLYSVDGKEIGFAKGRFTLNSGRKNFDMDLKEVMEMLTLKTGYEIITGSSNYKPADDPLSFVVCWAKVAVDERAKSVQVKHIIQAVDVGQPINPDVVEGQIHGGISMGLGYALTEEIEIDRITKKVLSSDLLHYNTPLALDMPAIHTHIVTSYESTGPFGAKSVGELPTPPVAPAIVNAIYNATGTYMTAIPITHTYYPKGSNS